MAAFLDIEGAFINIQPQAILNELDHLGVDPLLKSNVDQLLRCTKIGCKRHLAGWRFISPIMEYCNKSFGPQTHR